MPIAVVPRLLVAVTAAGWDEPVQDGRQVLEQSGFELKGANRRRATNVEDIHAAGTNAGCGNRRRYLPRQIVHVAMALCADGNLLLIVHNWAPFSQTR